MIHALQKCNPTELLFELFATILLTLVLPLFFQIYLFSLRYTTAILEYQLSPEDYVEDTIVVAPLINGKDILILDDTLTTGTSVSLYAERIIEQFAPHIITIITLFPKL